MTIYYLDSSVWVKRYYEEPGTGWLLRWIAQGPKLASSRLGYIEVLCTLARKQRRGELSNAEFERSTDRVSKDQESFLIIDLGAEVSEVARKTVSTLSLSGPDMAHLASAIVLRESFEEHEELMFFSCDGKLKHAATLARFQVLDPEVEESKRRR